jgi:hypothetical protein
VIRTVHFSYIHLENLNRGVLTIFLHILHFSYRYVHLLYLTFYLTCKTIVRSDISYTFLTHILHILHFFSLNPINSHGASPLCQKILTRPYGYKTWTISWQTDGWMDRRHSNHFTNVTILIISNMQPCNPRIFAKLLSNFSESSTYHPIATQIAHKFHNKNSDF